MHAPASVAELEPTRREALRKGATLGGAVVAGAMVPSLLGVRNAFAQTTTDAAIVAGALALEQTAVLTYSAAVSSRLLDPASTRIARVFGKQEQEHADALEAALRKLGGQPLPKPTPASLKGLSAAKSANDILAFAITLEEMAVAAYFDAAQKLKDSELLQTGASIMANEGQHLVVLRSAANKPPVPNAFETGEK